MLRKKKIINLINEICSIFYYKILNQRNNLEIIAFRYFIMQPLYTRIVSMLSGAVCTRQTMSL